MKISLASVMIVAACGACSNDGAKVDAAPPTVDIDNGSCGDMLRFTGELVDWDSNDGAGGMFCGVGEATFMVPPDGAMDVTAPNGRFDLCISATDPTTRIDVTPLTTDSPCAHSPYPIPGLVVADRDVIRAGAPFSARMFTTAREASFFTQVGASFDPTKAQLLVFVAGTPRAVSIAASHGASQAYTKATATWAAGDTGYYVFFPNVDPTGGTTTATVTGGAFGAGSAPLVAGTITAINVYAR